MDSAFKTAPYVSYTTVELQGIITHKEQSGDLHNIEIMRNEILRREKVKNGDRSVMTAGERLHSR